MSLLLSKTKKLISDLDLEPDLVHLGQHFLVNKTVIKKFVAACEIKPNDRILEIGPGIGHITEELLKTGSSVTAVEIDERFKPRLNDLAYQYSNFNYVIDNVFAIFGRTQGSIPMLYNLLNRQRLTLPTINRPIASDAMICGSLSYAIFEPLLYQLIKIKFARAVFLISQKFLSEKSVIKIILDAFFDWEIVTPVDRQNFYPAVKYSGIIIKLFPSPKKDRHSLLWRELILQSDKKIKNALKEILIKIAKLNNSTLTQKQAIIQLNKTVTQLKVLEKRFPNLNRQEINYLNNCFLNLV